MTEELNVDELETPPYTPPYPTDDELDWYVNIFFTIFCQHFHSLIHGVPHNKMRQLRVETNKSAALYGQVSHSYMFEPWIKCHTEPTVP